MGMGMEMEIRCPVLERAVSWAWRGLGKTQGIWAGAWRYCQNGSRNGSTKRGALTWRRPDVTYVCRARATNWLAGRSFSPVGHMHQLRGTSDVQAASQWPDGESCWPVGPVGSTKWVGRCFQCWSWVFLAGSHHGRQGASQAWLLIPSVNSIVVLIRLLGAPWYTAAWP